ncbi:hypothetical protein AKJ54_01075 [candidate division MSBL1 archaeon SCGC-AAA382K21]|uniref:Uncharacterized protein n=1 Tax=candidate division MSBL1 archaeon SCGC-AAA382K21 TaxID=1698283 RepID=A0A133VK49_9EURY|nr:hypothetical protein AKJ54_01075 [candidate division MSBL1 archaeon SCGC-AAA382K21]
MKLEKFFRKTYQKLRRIIERKFPSEKSEELLYLLETARRLFEVGDEKSSVFFLKVVVEAIPGFKITIKRRRTGKGDRGDLR